ncbi:MAG TPA: zinc transporter ZntB [Patescibacteria group bacterium]|nr:zinc transporter ZntB [Patescibacteria group bacterium]
MEETKSCLLSYSLDGSGHAEVVDLAAIKPDDERLIWIHLNGRHPDAKKFLREQLKLDPVVVKTMLAEEMRPRLEEMGGQALLMLRGINFNPGPTPEDLVSVRLWIAGNRIVSVGRRKSKTVADLDERIRHGRGPKRVGEFVAMMCSSLNDGIEPSLQELEDTMDRLEAQSLENPDERLRNDIAAIRKQATLFRRHIAPQREVFNRLQFSQASWMLGPDKWLMQDNSDRMTRYLEDLEALRDRANILQDELQSALSGKLNRNIYILSVITAIFMPLSFFSGLLGMNVKGIPGADHPEAFGIACVIALVLAVVQVLVFRRLKWL